MEKERDATPAPLIWSLPPPPGRRGSLDRTAIVRAAVEVADIGGVPALTMSAVARHLGTYTAMALYRYVASKEGLIDLMLDAVAAEMPVPDHPSGDWRGDLRGLAAGAWVTVRRHLWYAQLFHTRPPVGPHQMRRTEFALSVLTGAGVGTGEAMTYAALIDRYVLGDGLQEAEETRMRRRYGLDGDEAFLAAVRSMHELAVAGGGHPQLARWLAAPSSPAPEERFELGLRWLLDGIAGHVREDATGAHSAKHRG